jgi:hypothetical protein
VWPRFLPEKYSSAIALTLFEITIEFCKQLFGFKKKSSKLTSWRATAQFFRSIDGLSSIEMGFAA